MDVSWVLDWNDEDFHVGVVAVGLVDSIAEVGSEHVGESSCLRVAEFDQRTAGYGSVSDVKIVGYFSDLVRLTRKVDDIPVVGIARKHFPTFFGAVNHSQSMVKEKGSIEASDIGIGLDDSSGVDSR